MDNTKDTIRQYDSEVHKKLEEKAKTNVYAFEKDYFDGAHDLFIILRNSGLLKNEHQRYTYRQNP